MPDSKCAFEEEGCLYKEDCADGGWDFDHFEQQYPKKEMI